MACHKGHNVRTTPAIASVALRRPHTACQSWRSESQTAVARSVRGLKWLAAVATLKQITEVLLFHSCGAKPKERTQEDAHSLPSNSHPKEHLLSRWETQTTSSIVTSTLVAFCMTKYLAQTKIRVSCVCLQRPAADANLVERLQNISLVMVGDDTHLNSCVAQAISRSLGYVPLVTAQIIEQLTQQRQVSVRIPFFVPLISPCCKSGRMHTTPV